MTLLDTLYTHLQRQENSLIHNDEVQKTNVSTVLNELTLLGETP